MTEDILNAMNEVDARTLLGEAFSRKLIRLTSWGEWEYHPPDHLTMEASEIKRRLREGPSFHEIETIENILRGLRSEDKTNGRTLLNDAFSQGLIELMSTGEWEYRPPPLDLDTIKLSEIRRRLRGESFTGIKIIEDILNETSEMNVRILLKDAFSRKLIREMPAGEWEYHPPTISRWRRER